MADTKDSSAVFSTPKSPTPSVASMEGTAEAPKANVKVFKSNLQVLLKKQDTELEKTREYKKKLEEEGHEEDNLSSDVHKANKNGRHSDRDGGGRGRGGGREEDNDEVFEETKSKDKKKESTNNKADAEVMEKVTTPKNKSKESRKDKNSAEREASKKMKERPDTNQKDKGKSKKESEEKRQSKKESPKSMKKEEETSKREEKSPKKEEKTSEKEEKSTKKEEKSTKKEEKSSKKEEKSTKKEEKSSEKEEKSTKKEEKSSEKEEKLTKKEEKLTKKEEKSTKKEEKLTKKEEKPITKEEKPPKKEDTPTNKEEKPSKKESEKNRKDNESQKKKDKMESKKNEDQTSHDQPKEEEKDEPRNEGGKIVDNDDSKTGNTDRKNTKKEKSNDEPDIQPTSPTSITSTSTETSTPLSASSLSTNDSRNNLTVQESKDRTTASMKKREKQQGSLLKKGSGPFSMWKKYYFVLDGKLLMYYRSGSDYKGLSGAKGSLDLTLLEDVRIKKASKMKANFPFCLSRRNLKPIHLAAETEDDREKWMSILRGTLGNPSRLSGSENVLSTTDSPTIATKQEKYATMPVRADTSRAEESFSDSEEEKKDEPVLIQPKRVTRVGTGINLDLSSIKLKRVETSKKQDEHKPSESEKRDTGEIFGIKLKKPSVITEKDRLDKNETPKLNEGSDNETTMKRSPKQPKIPLNKSSLMSHAETEPNKLSPRSNRENTIERKRSPSPSIPLSKGVHAFLTKSSEDNQENDSEIPSDMEKVNDVPICIALSNEIRYSDDLLSMDDTPVIECVQVEERIISPENDNADGNKKENPQVVGAEEDKEATCIPQVSITVKENSDETEYEEFDEEFLKIIEENKTAELTNRESGRFSDQKTQPSPSNLGEDVESEGRGSSKGSDDEISTGDSKQVPLAIDRVDQLLVKHQHSSGPVEKEEKHYVDKSPSAANESKDNQVDEELLKNVSAAHRPSVSSMNDSNEVILSSPSGPNATPTHSPHRMRSPTNESTNSSGKSDPENSDKKVGKFKFFQSMRSGSGDRDKQEEAKDTKERKRKTSSFSKFLPGKKNKDRRTKDEEDMKLSLTKSSPSVSEQHEFSQHQPANANVEKIEKSDTTTNTDLIPGSYMETTVLVIEKNIQDDGTEKEDIKQVELRHNQHVFAKEESRCSTYSRTSTTSREVDPPPLVPEKKGARSKSPEHDVPQSNQPVGSAPNDMHDIESDESEEGTKVDGMISQEQINAILSAKDNRERRRKSSSRGSVGALVLPDSFGNGTEDNSISRRPSKASYTSTESDEPLPRTHFLCDDRNSFSSVSSKNPGKSDDSDVSSETQITPLKNPGNPPDQEQIVVLRKPSRLTECLVSGPRVSLTLPEFTVMEEEGPGTPDYVKDDPETKLMKTYNSEEEEQDDYFPVMGGGVELRHHSPSRFIKDSSDAGMRTSGIIGLKAYLEENQEELTDATSGISRLGHSAAVEKIKRESSEDS